MRATYWRTTRRRCRNVSTKCRHVDGLSWLARRCRTTSLSVSCRWLSTATHCNIMIRGKTFIETVDMIQSRSIWQFYKSSIIVVVNIQHIKLVFFANTSNKCNNIRCTGLLWLMFIFYFCMCGYFLFFYKCICAVFVLHIAALLVHK